MELLALLDAQAKVLAETLRAFRIPKGRRGDARQLLQRAFAFAAEDGGEETGATVGPEACLALIDAIERLLRSSGGPALRPLRAQKRLSARGPIRIGRLVRPSQFAAMASRYLDVGKRNDARVEWFWKRCEQNQQGLKKERSVTERAAEEFAGEDLEYVWGRRRPKGQPS